MKELQSTSLATVTTIAKLLRYDKYQDTVNTSVNEYIYENSGDIQGIGKAIRSLEKEVLRLHEKINTIVYEDKNDN